MVNGPQKCRVDELSSSSSPVQFLIAMDLKEFFNFSGYLQLGELGLKKHFSALCPFIPPKSHGLTDLDLFARSCLL